MATSSGTSSRFVVVTGANRGIGLELTRQLIARGDRVAATARKPDEAEALRALAATSREHLTVLACDVTDGESVNAFAKALGERAVDLLINNAGVWGGEQQTLEALDFEAAVATYQANALGPLRMAIALRPHLRRGRDAKIVSITSGMASIGENTGGGSYAYRMSKAALNMMNRSLAVDLKRDKIASAVMNPGWVQTDMGGKGAPTTVTDSAAGILAQIDGLSLSTTGEFLRWQGGRTVW